MLNYFVEFKKILSSQVNVSVIKKSHFANLKILGVTEFFKIDKITQYTKRKYFLK